MIRTKMFLVSIIVIGVVLVYMALLSIRPAVDWTVTFRPAALRMMRGGSPYGGLYINPPWAVGLLIPIATLPMAHSRAVLFVVTLVALAVIAHKMGGSRYTMILFLLSPPVVGMLLFGGLDWMALLGLLLHPPIGAIFLSIKPQTTIGILIYWVVLLWQWKKLDGLVRVFFPLGVAVAVSFLAFGFWPSLAFNMPGYEGNDSLWPWGIPIGLVLLFYAIYKKDVRFAAAASPFLSPYVLVHSWCVVLLPLLGSPIWMTLVVIGMWMSGMLN